MAARVDLRMGLRVDESPSLPTSKTLASKPGPMVLWRGLGVRPVAERAPLTWHPVTPAAVKDEGHKGCRFKSSTATSKGPGHRAFLAVSHLWTRAIQADGKIVAAGGSDSRFALVHYNPDEILDTTFGGDGKVITRFASGSYDFASAVALQPDGNIVVAGGSILHSHSRFALARYLAASGSRARGARGPLCERPDGSRQG